MVNCEFRRSTFAVMVDPDGNRRYSDLSQVLDLIGSLENSRNVLRFYGYLIDIYKREIRQMTAISELRNVDEKGILSPAPFVQTAYVYTPRINEVQTWKNGKLVGLWQAGARYHSLLPNLERFTGSLPPPDVCISVVNQKVDPERVELVYSPGLVYA